METNSPRGRIACTSLSDDDLVYRVKHLAACERRATVGLIRSLVEFDSRGLYLREGCSSLFTYCTQMLHMSEGSAYNRIETARAARRYPSVLEALERGDVTLTAIRLLAPHLTAANHCDVLTAAPHRSKQAILELIASLNPRPAATTIVRRVPLKHSGDYVSPVSAAEEDGKAFALGGVVTAPRSSGTRHEALTSQAQFPATTVTPLAPE